MKTKLRNIVNRNQRIIDYILSGLLLILGAILLWDLLIIAVRIATGLLMIGFGFYLILRNKENYRVRFFRF